MQVPRRGYVANEHEPDETHGEQENARHEQQQTAVNLHKQGEQQHREEQARTPQEDHQELLEEERAYHPMMIQKAGAA